MPQWIYLSVAIISEVIGTSALNASDGFTRLLPSVVVVVAYLVSFFFLSLTLKTIPVGIAYAIWSGAGVALITLIGWVLFGQTLDLAGVIGISLIVLGVVVLNLFSSSVAQG
ncbi:multidrug efflux SMR transporter [Thiohalocapsa marina]|uniref:Multidrug efflux SMR transporter n=1 Tax=Thiohalocapsa marina TaxID=424902 RepID=A0A5M8FKH9_9GAMM|nr:multidrug efflux SMR transporter [Thiohalocapsa marina]KAA6185408.1 multidrug efflux SMR transporter [Thiohalocapsa marina]